MAKPRVVRAKPRVVHLTLGEALLIKAPLKDREYDAEQSDRDMAHGARLLCDVLRESHPIVHAELIRRMPLLRLRRYKPARPDASAVALRSLLEDEDRAKGGKK